MANEYTYNEQHPQHDVHRQFNDNRAPFKRTAEKVLTWIGIVLHALWVIILLGAISLFKNPDFQKEIEATGQDIGQLGSMSAPVVIGWLAPLILALVAVFIFKKPILAGILLIIAAIVGVFLSGSVISAILWLIAGIMLLVRKPKRPQYVSTQHDDDYRYQTHDDTVVDPKRQDERNGY